jgi:hypothetical protein
MSPKARDVPATLIAYDGDREPVVLETTKQELDRMFRESIIRGALASEAVEEGGVIDEGLYDKLLEEDRKKYG